MCLYIHILPRVGMKLALSNTAPYPSFFPRATATIPANPPRMPGMPCRLWTPQVSWMPRLDARMGCREGKEASCSNQIKVFLKCKISGTYTEHCWHTKGFQIFKYEVVCNQSLFWLLMNAHVKFLIVENALQSFPESLVKFSYFVFFSKQQCKTCRCVCR